MFTGIKVDILLREVIRHLFISFTLPVMSYILPCHLEFKIIEI